jgi:hypothetical protein
MYLTKSEREREMRLRLPKRQPGTPGAEAFLAYCSEAVDRSIPGLRTVLMIAGIVAAAAHAGKLADFLFATGLLFHLAISFEGWWIAKRTR